MSGKVLETILLNALAQEGISDFVGVPDSTLKSFLVELEQRPHFSHIAATNECEAIALAAGQFLASGQPALVYMQNSGLGKVVNPICSLMVREVCQIPALLLIGHRAHPVMDKADEPQHLFMGQITTDLLDLMKIPYQELVPEEQAIGEAVHNAMDYMKHNNLPYALIVPPHLFGKKKIAVPENGYSLVRRDVIAQILDSCPKDTFYVATTGKIARELYFEREKRGQGHEHDFYVVGAMGGASAIACGIAGKNKARQVCVLDGDGAFLMQMGSVATIGVQKLSNLSHIVLDNESYESTGGQASISNRLSFMNIAKACQYVQAESVEEMNSLTGALSRLLQKTDGAKMLVIKVSTYSDPQLGRPEETPEQNARAFRNTFMAD